MHGLLALVAIVSLSWADQTQPPKPKPVIHRVDGEPVTATFPSGDVVELRLNRNPLVQIVVPFQVTENFCSEPVGQRFNFRATFRIDRFRWIWIKHRDPAKIGQSLKLKGSSIALESGLYLSNPVHMSLGKINDDFPPDVLEFSDMSWLPSSREFTIDSWFTEKMVINPETGVSENRVAASLNGLKVVRDGQRHAQIVSLESVDTPGFSGLLLTVGDVVTWVFATGPQRCQISMKPDIGAATDQITNYVTTKLNEETVGYKWNEDGLTSLIGDNDQSYIFSFLGDTDD